MKKSKKILKNLTKITIVMVVIGIVCYGGIYLYAWMSPKLTVNSAKSYYFYDKNENSLSIFSKLMQKFYEKISIFHLFCWFQNSIIDVF